MDNIKAISGFDLEHANLPPMPEPVLNCIDANAPRKKGRAFCTPVRPGKFEPLREKFNQAMGPRRAEMQESRRALRISRDCAWLNRIPTTGVEVLSVYVEADDPIQAIRDSSVSTKPFDIEFRNATTEALEIDFSKRPPEIEQLFDWQASGASASAGPSMPRK